MGRYLIWVVLFTLGVTFLGSNEKAYGNEIPRSMAALGDSMTEGLLAEFTQSEGISFGEFFEMMGILGLSKPSVRIDNFRDRYAIKPMSWATGLDRRDDIESHAERLREYNPYLYTQNFAVAGSSAWDLRYQVDELNTMQDEYRLEFDYITLLIGANDLVANSIRHVPSAAQYGQWIETALRELLEENEDAKILMVGIPNIFEIFQSTADLTVIRVWDRRITCEDLRSIIYGDALIFNPEHPDYAEVGQRHQDYNKELHKIQLLLSLEFPNARIKITPPGRARGSRADVISVDCFHPSEEGQAQLAESTWENSFWPDL